MLGLARLRSMRHLAVPLGNLRRPFLGVSRSMAYERKTPLEHVLLRPGMYVGQVEVAAHDTWIVDPNSKNMMRQSIKYPPALLKIFDEILVNAADNRVRSKAMSRIEIQFNRINDGNLEISVLNNGLGIPVEIHPTEKIYNPELIFGHLLTGSNFDDTQNRLTGGRHGYGAKLANIFSNRFTIETYDAEKSLLYIQTWESNMSKCNPPEIKKVKLKEDYTKVTFVPDLRKFGNGDYGGMSSSDFINNVEALLTRRVYDVAGCVAPIKVFLNSELLPVKSFIEYVQLYSAASLSENEAADKIFYYKPNDRWEIALTRSPTGNFEHVSFVNCVWTSKGGSHLNHIMNQLTSNIHEYLQKNNVNVSAYQIKNKIRLFAKCSIESPTFDSQGKDTLTSNINDFGSACPLSKTFIKKFIEESGIIEELINDSRAKELTKMAKTSKSTKQVMVDKLEDAHMAGTSKSELCTLILTEGDSAKALAVAGLEVVGRQYYGVLPLRGKFLNVKHVPIATISSNKEVVDLAKALGLNFSKKYENGLQGAGLRYGHILIMCDQDHDGSHIKGLIINFIHEFWPALLKHEGYLQQFITPILKATVNSGTKQSQQHSFFSIAEFNEWKSSLSKAALSKVSIKYYKGLGTSTAAEGREYFRDLEKHKKLFTYSENCDEQLDLVFNKSRAKDRKEWLSSSYAPDVYIDPSIEKISFSDFINKEMIHFSHADNIRSIPSSIDGLKPSQRKVLFGCFKKNITSEIKVVQLAGYISEHSCYHHGETSLHHSIINMAQNFVGSNNVPYLLPLGQFGSRAQGGSDAASPRYIFTKLSPLTRYIFPEADDDILEYLEEDGTMVEPKYYVPVVPAILINGAKGIGTGWSVSIPPYNPLDLVKYIENKLKGVTTSLDLIPWIRGFQGSIKACRDASSFDVSGVLVKVKDYNYQITELPYEEWTENYKNFLAGLQAKGLIKEFTENHSSDSVNFDIKLHKNSDIDDKELFQALKLKKKLSYQNMHCFDSAGNIKRFENPKQIIEEFIPVRLAYYDKRKENLLKNLAINEEIARHKSNFINDVLSKKIALLGGSKDILSENSVISQLKALGYPAFNDIIKGDKLDGKPYGYLLDMPIHSLTVEKSSQLTQSAKEALAKLEKLKATTPKDMWLADLAVLKKALTSYYSTK